MKNFKLFFIAFLVFGLSCSKSESSSDTNYQLEEQTKVYGKPQPQNFSSGGIYKAYVTQSGTSDPNVVVFENTLGGTVTWTRFAIGNYQATLSGGFPVGKTFIPIFGTMGGGAQVPIAYSLPAEYFYSVVNGHDGNSFSLQIYDANYNNVELSSIIGEGYNIPIWIEVYP